MYSFYIIKYTFRKIITTSLYVYFVGKKVLGIEMRQIQKIIKIEFRLFWLKYVKHIHFFA